MPVYNKTFSVAYSQGRIRGVKMKSMDDGLRVRVIMDDGLR